MKVTAKEQYGLRAMAELAKTYGRGPVPLSEVAQAQGRGAIHGEAPSCPRRELLGPFVGFPDRCVGCVLWLPSTAS